MLLESTITIDQAKYNFRDSDGAILRPAKGLSAEVVKMISNSKQEPNWLLNYRLKALEIFRQKSLPDWGADLSALDFDDIYYYLNFNRRSIRHWNLPHETCFAEK